MILEAPTSAEQSLIIAAQSGDRAALELIAARHRAAVMQHARRMLRSPEDVEDAVQETFVKAFRALGNFDASRPLSPWLMRICTNCCVDIIRSRKVQPESLDCHEFALSDEKAEVGTGAENRLVVDLIRDAVGRLPKQYREAILLRHANHMDVEEIARKLNKPEGTIKSWLFRARALLKKDLSPAMVS
jgi:RNA polymerase sigma-70 factor (ECF subfamily)